MSDTGCYDPISHPWMYPDRRPMVVKSTDYAATHGRAVNIGRDRHNPEQHFGNPFSHSSRSLATVIVKTRKEAIENFRKWILGEDFLDVEPVRRAWVLLHLPELRNRDLACPGNCAPNPCHGDVLLELANKEA
jgi:hypothetical protein